MLKGNGCAQEGIAAKEVDILDLPMISQSFEGQSRVGAGFRRVRAGD